MSLVPNKLSGYKKGSIFVETGTFLGQGCVEAIKAGFDEVYTIEILEENYKKAERNFEKKLSLDDRNKIHMHLGDSAELLGEILNGIKEPCTIWLDAHGNSESKGWRVPDGNEYASVGEVCRHGSSGRIPLEEELKSIESKDHTILIDDVGGYLFNKNNISKNWLEGMVSKINPDYQIDYVDGAKTGTILWARC